MSLLKKLAKNVIYIFGIKICIHHHVSFIMSSWTLTSCTEHHSYFKMVDVGFAEFIDGV